MDSTANSIVVEDLTSDLSTVRWTVKRAELCGAGSSGAASNGTRYIVYVSRLQWSREKAKLCEAAGPSPFTDPVRGTWQTDPHKGGTRYLWAGYRYQPPQMGFWVDPPGAPALGVYGAATGANRLGQYYCWNRNYDVNLGRWTTPDPVATPWWNLHIHCEADPVVKSDSSGMSTEICFRRTEKAGSVRTSVGSCGSAAIAFEYSLSQPAGQRGGYFTFRTVVERVVWRCPMQGQKVDEEGASIPRTRYSEARYVPPGSARPLYPLLIASNNSFPDTHGWFSLWSRIHFHDGATAAHMEKLGFKFPKVNLGRGLGLSDYTKSLTTDRNVGFPKAESGESIASTSEAQLKVKVDWDCCCSRDETILSASMNPTHRLPSTYRQVAIKGVAKEPSVTGPDGE